MNDFNQQVIEEFRANGGKVAQFGEVIILVVYLPILFLRGIEGKLFAPMAMTVNRFYVALLVNAKSKRRLLNNWRLLFPSKSRIAPPNF